MVTKIADTVFDATENRAMAVFDVRCLSTDDKPTDVTNGSTLLEIDTGTMFLFDADSSEWKEL